MATSEPHPAAAPPGARAADAALLAVADVHPYYGGPDGFADVYDLVDAACLGLLDHLVAAYDLRAD